VVGHFGKEYKSGALLAFLDIAVVSQDTDKVIALIEIEETTDKPKVLLWNETELRTELLKFLHA
jgi:hypothetical protein